jgi:dihydrofolate reductase
MGRIVINTNTTLDGVVQDPTGDEGFSHGGWFTEFGGADLAPWAELMTAQAMRTEALLLGRRTDEWFASRWLAREGVWADRLNGLPKYVVSTTLDEPKWSNATVLRGDVVEDVSKVKAQYDGEIEIFASYQLVHTLVEHDLVDELRLFVFPCVLGGGRRLFGETTDLKPLRLLDKRTIGDSLLFLTYEFVR